MTVKNSDFKRQSCRHEVSVRLRAGASLVKIKPIFTPDSKYILVASGFDVKVFSLSSGECNLTFKVHTAPVVSMCINPENSLQVLSCSEDGTVIKWDYSDGKALKKFNLGFTNKVAAFHAVASCKLWFVSVCKGDDYAEMYSLNAKTSHDMVKEKLLYRIRSSANSVAVGPQGNYVAGVYENYLCVYDLKNKAVRRHMTGEIKLICVACHPSEYTLATGDVNGQIIVWTGMLDSNHPTRTKYHWHSLPLPDLTFSPEGAHIYSAGGESVLVKWNLNSGKKDTIPRLGLPICLLAVSPDNKFIATAHIDNALQIINSHNVVVQVIQGLNQGHYHQFGITESLPVGMLYDVRSKAIVTNGRPGHLQFYNILEDKQLFHLDIVGQNYICQERDRTIINTDVIRAAVDSRGTWLATVEYRDDGETSPEIRLKFWKFDETSQKFVLNTNIFLPHNKKINSLKFQPEDIKVSKSEHIPMAVTTSGDNRFKIWTLMTSQNDKVSWSCELMGYYKEMMPTEVCFSDDGSLLCVVFDHVATLWSSESITLKTALNHPQSTDSIRQVIFGHKDCHHLLVYCTDSLLVVWNVLSLSVLWSVSCCIQYLVGDPFSDVMAAFTDDKNLFIFKPSEPKPLSVIKKVSAEPIISAIFVPQTKKEEQCFCWQQHSKLYFFNKNQELLVLDNSEDEMEETEKVVLQPSLPYTPFGVLQAEHTVTDVQRHETKKLISDWNGDQPMDFLCPTTVNTVAFCEAVLQDLLKGKSRSHMHNISGESSYQNCETDSDADVVPEQVEERTDIVEAKVTPPSKIDCNMLKDYSFLLNFGIKSD